MLHSVLVLGKTARLALPAIADTLAPDEVTVPAAGEGSHKRHVGPCNQRCRPKLEAPKGVAENVIFAAPHANAPRRD